MNKPGWTVIARQLCDFLQINERKIEFLRTLDKKVMDEDTDLDALFDFALQESSVIIGASRAHIYVLAGNIMLLSASTSHTSVPETIKAASIIDRLASHSGSTCLIKSSDCQENDKRVFPGEVALLGHIKPEEIFSFGMIVFEADHPEEIHPFVDEEKTSFASVVANQLSLAVKFKREEARRKHLWTILSSFFEVDLKPSQCLKIVANHFCKFLPSYRPLKLTDMVDVQILFHEKKEDFLTIRATTGKEPDSTRVDVSDSVSGLLIEDTSLSSILCNPKIDYPERYKDYLGKHEQREMLTELAIPISQNGERFAVINLESPVENAFLEPHINSVMSTVKLFSPILYALKLRIKRSRTQQRGLMESLAQHLSSLTSQYLHKTEPAFCSMSLALDRLEQLSSADDTKASEAIKSLRTSFATLFERRDWFCSKVPAFSDVKVYPVNSLLQEALSLFNWENLAQKRNIQLEFVAGKDYKVETSSFLVEVFRNIIDNAIYWIGDRMNKDPQHDGKLRITVTTFIPAEEDQEIELNTFCRIRFWDNGLGVPRKSLLKVFDPEFSRRPSGVGLGLNVAKEYLVALGGWIAADSEPGEFFLLDIYLRLNEMEKNKDA